MKRKHGPILFWAFTVTDKIEILLTQSTAAFATEEKISSSNTRTFSKFSTGFGSVIGIIGNCVIYTVYGRFTGQDSIIIDLRLGTALYKLK
ncbi:hypothetical protein PNOK_0154100 [Pyrrhoderma noxium]|uniref:Uncharacterized protein n=1 Tax=Pyrrhoderma noxium TaxID=2282107 RepID=A0A286UQ00_9AGAM|nr:hypothetical protein PNOK_0154100 [Pyrrhoderma noxium]